MTSTVTRPGPARVRHPAVAGSFYPGRADQLTAVIDQELADAAAAAAVAAPSDEAIAPKALIVPHAGYVYSAPIAATAYAHLVPWRDRIRRVVLLGPAHRVPVRSMAVSSADEWETPLGRVPVDHATRARILALPSVTVDDRAHAPEHSLEVHVPFLQRVLGHHFTLLPVVVGPADPDDVATVLDEVWGGDETLIVVSTDLSHYLDYTTAQDRDEATAAAIVAGRLDDIGPYDACGCYPVRGMLAAARTHQLDIELVDLRNSGDTAGPGDRVVGYGSFVLRPRVAAENGAHAVSVAAPSLVDGFTGAETRALLDAAEAAIRAHLEQREPLAVERDSLPPRVLEPGAAFVTLREGDRLLGCIGTLEPRQPLIDDVAENAVAAAFRDPRMAALTPDEFEAMSVHISVLTPAVPIDVDNWDELRRVLRPHVDGVLVECSRHRGTFLPSVWEQLPEPDAFLGQLWVKAGLRKGTWPKGLRVSRYHSVEFGDDGPRPPVAPNTHAPVPR